MFFVSCTLISRVSDPHFFCGSGSGQKYSCGSGSWGYPGEGAGGKGKKWVFFFTFQMILNNGCLKSEQKKWNCLHCTSPTLQNNDLFIHFLTFLPGSGSANLCGSGSGQGKNMRILRIRIRNPALMFFLFDVYLLHWSTKSLCRWIEKGQSCSYSTVSLKQWYFVPCFLWPFMLLRSLT